MVDIGTGDGRFVLDYAKQHPDTLCIGIDASLDGLADASRRAARKPARGGVSNALFILCAAEQLPKELRGFADIVTINYPWGSLLKAVIEPRVDIMKKIARLAKPNASLRILLNESQQLPSAELVHVVTAIKPACLEAGLRITKSGLVDKPLAATTWGQKLVKGSGRQVLQIHAALR